MKQKIVIQVSMNDEKSRSKALKMAASFLGLDSTALQGPEKDKIEVTGDGIDAVQLTTMLRKRLGFADLISVSPVGDGKKGGGGGEKKEGGGDQKKNQDALPPPVPYYYFTYPPYQIHEVRDPNDYRSCTIF